MLQDLVGRETLGELRQVREMLNAAVETGRVRRDQAEEQHSQLRAELAEIRNVIGKSQSPREELGYRITELMMSPDLGFSASQLRTLGFDTALQDFVAAVRNAADRKTVRLAMAHLECRTREIKMCRRDEPIVSTAQVDVLRIGSDLQMELQSARNGYVTVVNFGTSGSAWLCVPNTACGIDESRIDAGQLLRLPGTHLLPQNVGGAKLDLREIGPVGREHIILIVSTELLVGQPILERIEQLRRSEPEGLPFLKLSVEDIKLMDSRLRVWPEGDWDAAVLSFDVVP